MRHVRVGFLVGLMGLAMLVATSARAQSVDSEAAARASELVGEWQLFNADRTATLGHSSTYATSSVAHLLQGDHGRDIGIISGLAGLDGDARRIALSLPDAQDTNRSVI
jgi:hypothetical protein